MLNSKFQLFVAAVALCATPSIGQGVGTDICACQPSVYELTLDFGLTCGDTTVGGDGIFDQDCLIATRLPDTINVTDLVPVTVSEIQILELDQFQDVVGIVIYNEGPYFNGDIVTYTSIVRSTPEFINPVTLPRGFQVSIVGNNAQGQPIINTWGILYDNDCGIFPLLTEGQTIGWTIFTDLGDPPLSVCPIAPPTDFPTASPVVTRTESPTVSPTSAPTASPVVSRTESPTVSPTSAPTASPVAPRTESPVATPTATASPVASRTESPTSAPTASPVVAPTASPVVAPTASPVVSRTESPISTPTATPPTATLPPVSGKRGGTNNLVQEDDEAEEEDKNDASYDGGSLEGKRDGSTSSGKAKKKSKQYSGKMSKVSRGKAGKSSSSSRGKAGGKAGGKRHS